MRVEIRLHPGSSKEEIKKLKEDKYEVWIKERAIDGKANLFLIKFLKKYFGVKVKLIKGAGHFNTNSGYTEFAELLDLIKRNENFKRL